MKLHLIAAALVALSVQSWSQQVPKVNGPAITGNITIKYNTRLRENIDGDNLPKPGVKDTYDVDLKAGAVGFKGKISDQPRLTKWLGTAELQPGASLYQLKTSVQGLVLGDWLGTVVTDSAGYYRFDANRDSKARFQIDGGGSTQRAFTDYFSGTLLGKGTGKPVPTVVRWVKNGKAGQTISTDNDPVEFRQTRLAKGPLDSHTGIVVNGKLLYDREQEAWITDGIDYQFEGRTKADKLTGGIRWTEEKEQAGKRKGSYSVRLFWNDSTVPGPQSEETLKAAAPAAVDEDNFIPVDNTKQGFGGTIDFVDTMDDVPSVDKDGKKITKRLPVESIVSFSVVGNNIDRPAVLALTKTILAMPRTFFGE